MLTLNAYEVRTILRRIAAAAFPDMRIKPFTIEILAQESRTRHGDWTWGPGMECPRIRIFNLSRRTGIIIKTCIHELAHHCDWIQRDHTDHSKLFYTAYKRLLEAAHDLGEVDLNQRPDEIEERDIRQLIRLCGAFSNGAAVVKETWVVRVGDGYDAREWLRAEGFTFSKAERAWVVEVADKAEARYLAEDAEAAGGRKVETMPANGREIVPIYFVTVDSRSAYEHRAALREHGLIWREDAGWFAKLPADEAVRLAKQLNAEGFKATCVGEMPKAGAGTRQAAARRGGKPGGSGRR